MSTRLPTVRKRENKIRVAMNVDLRTVERLRLLLLNEFNSVGYSDFVDWAVDVAEERLLKGGME